ncbi:hypothetical protein BGX29_002640 [Mortierella sp. GBA35]|nr:hypothetical protein BGX29_002640 [Mortierella sp. GBA35]
MSFMVDSEIDPLPPVDLASSSEDNTARVPEESSGQLGDQDKDGAEQAQDSVLTSDQQQPPTDSVTSQPQDANNIDASHSTDNTPAGPDSNTHHISANRAFNQQSQPMSGATRGADSSSHGQAQPAEMYAPGTSSTVHPLRSYPVMVPYYPYYHPAGLNSPPSSDTSYLQPAPPRNSTVGPHYWFPWFPVAGDAPPEQATNSATPASRSQSVPHHPQDHHPRGTQGQHLMSPPTSPTESNFAAGPGSSVIVEATESFKALLMETLRTN